MNRNDGSTADNSQWFRICQSQYGVSGTKAIHTTGGGDIPDCRIWFTISHNGRSLEITGMFTRPHKRKQGLATKLFVELLSAFPDVVHVCTASATPSGRAWLLKQGFEPPTNLDRDWTLVRVKSKKLANVKTDMRH